MDLLMRLCREQGLTALYLTVNRENIGSIAAYIAMGFRTVREQVTDIGEGYVMDDLVMEMCIRDSLLNKMALRKEWLTSRL